MQALNKFFDINYTSKIGAFKIRPSRYLGGRVYLTLEDIVLLKV